MATFTRLPDNALLQILSYLPFEERVRLARVSRCFRRMSLIAISKTKSLDVTENIFQNLTPDLFVILLNLCQDRLEKVQFGRTDEQAQVGRPNLVVAFAQFAFPRLIEVALGKIDQIDNDLFGSLIRNNENLKILICKSIDQPIITYPDFVSIKLETLKLGTCNDQFLNSLTGKCPNLKRFEIGYGRFGNKEALDNFFASCPNLETLIRFDSEFELPLLSLVHFWNLFSLRTLILYRFVSCLYSRRYQLWSDNGLTKLAASFPNLEILHLNNVKLTNRDVGALRCLKNLKNLALFDHNYSRNEVSLDAGIRLLANCHQLREAQFNVHLTPKTIRSFLTFCPDLNLLHVRGIEGAVGEEMEKEIAKSFVGVNRTDFTLRLEPGGYKPKVIWQSDEGHPVIKLETGRRSLFSREDVI